MLDIASGTGRVACELAQLGVAVDGIDISAEMVAVARAKAAGTPARFFVMDATTFQIDRTYGFVVVANGSFMHLLTDDQQRRCLDQVHQHLRPNGGLLIDLTTGAAVSSGTEWGEERWFCPPLGQTVVVTAEYRQPQGSDVVRCEYRFVPDSGEVFAVLRYCYRVPDVKLLTALLRETGFRVIRHLAGYTAMDRGRRHVVLAEKTA